MKKLFLPTLIVTLAVSCTRYQEYPLEGNWRLETEINLFSSRTTVLHDTIQYFNGETLEILPDGRYKMKLTDRVILGTWTKKHNGYTLVLDDGSESCTDAHIQHLSEKKLVLFTLISTDTETTKSTLHFRR